MCGLPRYATCIRLNNFTYRNGNLYPAHGVGPIAKMLNIDKGNRFIPLVSMSTKARGLHEYAGSGSASGPIPIATGRWTACTKGSTSAPRGLCVRPA